MEDLMIESAPDPDALMMAEMVAELLLEEDIDGEEKSALVASVTTPEPPVEDWDAYLSKVVDSHLHESILTYSKQHVGDATLLGFGLEALGKFIERSEEMELVNTELKLLMGLPEMLVTALKKHPENLLVALRAVGILAALPDTALEKEKLTMYLFQELVDVMERSHKHQNHGLWQYFTVVLHRLITYVARNRSEWKLGEKQVMALITRLVHVIELNYKHWEIYFLLSVVKVNLMPSMVERLVPTLLKSLAFHGNDGFECDPKKQQCVPDYENTPGWGSTLDMALDMCVSLCLYDASVLEQLVFLTKARQNRYAAGAEHLKEAETILNRKNLEMMVANDGVKTCISVCLSHAEYVKIKKHALTLLHLMCWSPNFSLEDLHRNGAGVNFLVAELERSEHDLAAGLLMLLAKEPRYKLDVLGRGFDQIWSIVHTPATCHQGLAIMTILGEDSEKAGEWFRKRNTDKELMDMLKDPMDLVMLKMVLDFLCAIDSPFFDKILEHNVKVDELVAVLFYFSSNKLSTTTLTHDPTAVLSRVLKVLTEYVRNASQSELRYLLQKHYGMTLMQLVWHLEPETPLWEAAADALHVLLVWKDQVNKERVYSWLAHKRQLAKDLNPKDERFAKVDPDTDPLFSTFFEGLFNPGMQRRQMNITEDMMMPPPNDIMTSGEIREEKKMSEHEIAKAQGRPGCELCGRIPVRMGDKLLRCGRCKKAWFCDRDHQRRAWPAHRKECNASVE